MLDTVEAKKLAYYGHTRGIKGVAWRKRKCKEQCQVHAGDCSVLSLAVLDPMVGHTMDVLSSFISVLCHSD